MLTNGAAPGGAPHRQPVPRQAAVLVGGLGTRLGALVDDAPKPMLEVAGRPFLEHLVLWLAGQGVREILLLAGYCADRIVGAFHGRTIAGAALTVAAEPEPRGTAGALREAAPLLRDRFVLLNGDSFFDIDLAALAAAGDGTPWTAGLALRPVPDAARYGVVEIDGCRITRFLERRPEPGPGLVNGGVAIVRRTILDAIGPPPASLEREVFPTLAARAELVGLVSEAEFFDIGVPDALAVARATWPGRAGPASTPAPSQQQREALPWT